MSHKFFILAFTEKYLYNNGSRLPADFSWTPVQMKKFKDVQMENGISDPSGKRFFFKCRFLLTNQKYKIYLLTSVFAFIG